MPGPARRSRRAPRRRPRHQGRHRHRPRRRRHVAVRPGLGVPCRLAVHRRVAPGRRGARRGALPARGGDRQEPPDAVRSATRSWSSADGTRHLVAWAPSPVRCRDLAPPVRPAPAPSPVRRRRPARAARAARRRPPGSPRGGGPPGLPGRRARCSGRTPARRARWSFATFNGPVPGPQDRDQGPGRGVLRRRPPRAGRVGPGGAGRAEDGPGSATRAASGTAPPRAPSASTARCGRRRSGRRALRRRMAAEADRRDPLRLQRRHRAARPAVGRRRPAAASSAPSAGSTPTGSTATPTSTGVGVVVVRLLGGLDALEAALPALAGRARDAGIPLVALGGEAAPDADLLAASTVPAGVAVEAHRYLAAGGPANVGQHGALPRRHRADDRASASTRPTPSPTSASGTAPGSAPRAGAGAPTVLWWPSSSTGPTWWRATPRTSPTSAVRSRTPAPTRSRSGPTRCAATTTARSPRCGAAGSYGVDVIITSTLAAGSADGGRRRVGRARPRRPRHPRHPGPVLGTVPPRLAGRRCRPHPARGGLRRGDPRVRRPHHRPDVLVQGGRGRRRHAGSGHRRRPGPIPSAPAGWRRWRSAPPGSPCMPTADRRIAVVLSAYPTKRARLGNAVGLDTPASAIALLRALRAAGYRVDRIPADGDALMDELAAGFTYDQPPLGPAQVRGGRRARCPPRGTDEWFAGAARRRRGRARRALGAGAGRRLRPRRRTCTSPGSTSAACWSRSSRRAGSARTPSAPTTPPTCPRPTTTWPSTGGSPPRRSRAAGVPTPSCTSASTARWSGCRARRWPCRPACYPDAAMADVPLFYPFVVNDPGEGTQAKRRAHAVVIDHLPPPLTRADTYDDLARLEQLLDALRPESRRWTRPSCRRCGTRCGSCWSSAEIHRDLDLGDRATRRWRLRRRAPPRRRLPLRAEGRPDPGRPARARQMPAGEHWSTPSSP